MFGLTTRYFKPPKVKTPPLPPPAAILDVGEETGEQAMKRARRRSGFGSTLMTGALTPKTGKRTTLG
jgi:hypothetical protein